MARTKSNKSIITQLADNIKPSSFLDYRQYLKSVYTVSKDEFGKSYSYKRFAEDLGFGATTVIHQIIKGYRPLSLKAAEKVIKALNLKGAERKYFLKLVEFTNSKATAKREETFNKLISLKNDVLPSEFDKDCLEFFSEWYHPVIHELVGLTDFQNDLGWIAGKLSPAPRPEQIKKSLELMQRLELITFDGEQDRYIQTNKRISTGHRVKGLAFVAYHQKMIDMGKESLTKSKGDKRDISALTLSIDEATFQKIKTMIHDFQMKILEVAEDVESPDRIYNVNMQLFPFTEE